MTVTVSFGEGEGGGCIDAELGGEFVRDAIETRRACAREERTAA